jgi:hypothetical protein
VLDAATDAHLDAGAPVPSEHTEAPHVGNAEHGGADEMEDTTDLASDAGLRGKTATQGMTAAEKRERQKQQNRRAAERSRNKKREEV